MRSSIRFTKQAFWFAFLLLSAAPGLRGEEPTYMRIPDVVYVGTPYDLVSEMLRLAQVRKDDLVVDLGCGDARMLVLAAQKYGSRGIGYEIDPDMVRLSRDNVEKNGVGQLVEIIQADIFTVDIRDADVIPAYLLPEMNLKLLPQLDALKPGSRLVFHNYDIEGILPDKTIEFISNEDNSSHTIYVYTTPLKRVK
ncbi:MAG: 50S ribosomal protein L11 methyltransferase [Acidobacteria bacterium]|nr:50S ribosomal protein L11 methyltransferase [Acidobacteriota bacterium]